MCFDNNLFKDNNIIDTNDKLYQTSKKKTSHITITHVKINSPDII